jgi:prepilin-type N-terminal cleavage/methylation domain-containing protein
MRAVITICRLPDRCSYPRLGRKLRGFSLVELVLVVCIMAVAAAMAVPRFASAVTRNRVDAASNRVVADLALAQRHARLSSAGQHVLFDCTTSSYRLPGLADPDHPNSEYEVRLADPPYEATLGNIVLGGNSELIFDPYGVPNTSGSVAVQCGEFSRVISIDAIGRTTIADGSSGQAAVAAALTSGQAAAAAAQAASGQAAKSSGG